MRGVIVIDTNLLVLLIVGTASRSHISRHERLSDYTAEDFDMIGLILAEFSDIILLPHVIAEVSSIARQIKNPARAEIQSALRNLIASCMEFPSRSIDGAEREEFGQLGITDAVILHFCAMELNGLLPTLLTADTKLANSAHSLGYSVIDYRQNFLSG